MLWHIKKVMHCHFPDLSNRLSSITDPRKGIHYTVEEVVMAAVVLFLFKCESRNSFNHKLKDEQFRSNYFRMFKLNPPHMDSVNDLIEKIEEKELISLRCRLLSSLIEKRVFHRFRFFSDYFCIGIDGTGAYHWGDDPDKEIKDFALKKESSTGKVSYNSLILESVLICNNGMTIPLISEWIANDGQKYDKQDCELKAFKRLAEKLKDYFPRLPVCLLVDGLYTNVALMDICQQCEWKFITVFKDGNLPSVWEEVESLLPLEKDNTIEQVCGDSIWWYTYNYKWLKDIQYQKHTVNWIKCVEENQHRKTSQKQIKQFVYLTNIDVNRDNVALLLKAGRARWGIEDHFNTQKNRGGNLHHKFNRNNLNAIKNWHNLRQLACMIGELVEYCEQIQSLLKQQSKMSLKELYANLNSYLTMCHADEVIVEFEHWSISPRQIRLE